MTKEEIRETIDRQRAFFKSGIVLDINFRKNALKKLKDAIIKYEPEINLALKADLGKSPFESYMCETGLVLSEITYMLRNIDKLAAVKKVKTPLSQFAAKSYIKPAPYGNVLIISPWNYPFLLAMEPFIDAIAAGNTAVIKPGEFSPNTSIIIKKIIDECFENDYVSVIIGGEEESAALLDMKFDYIFYTGGERVGKIVMKKAAEFLTPVTLELGGKSPCIVDSSADIQLAAKRIVFGKFLNCGQTCVAPDYIYCDENVKPKLITALCEQIICQYGTDPVSSETYGKIINEKHFSRIKSLIDADKVVFGGKCDGSLLKIEPTVMDNVNFSDSVMQEEIFGPVLPVISFGSLTEAAENINLRPRPLALYLFSSSKASVDYITEVCSFGGGCINDTLMHIASPYLPFGGIGESGMGSYHGKYGFDTFSHSKSILDKKIHPDLSMRYRPYSKSGEKLMRLFLK